MGSPYTAPPFAQARLQVYAVTGLVPAGRLVSYGDIAALLSMSPRAVGRAMAVNDEPDLPWWRVTNSAGDPPAHLHDEAVARWREEGIRVRANGRGAAIATFRADLAALADAAEALLGPLPGAQEDLC